jgi:hypothetical protein
VLLRGCWGMVGGMWNCISPELLLLLLLRGCCFCVAPRDRGPHLLLSAGLLKETLLLLLLFSPIRSRTARGGGHLPGLPGGVTKSGWQGNGLRLVLRGVHLTRRGRRHQDSKPTAKPNPPTAYRTYLCRP